MDRIHRGTPTPQDLLLPEGKLIRTTRGGASALKQLLLDLKKYSFSGYVRTVRNASGGRSEGVVLLRGGNPEASLHLKGDTRLKGRSALKQVWQDSYDESCSLELHARVDMDNLLHEYVDSVLERPTKVVKKSKVPQPVDREEVERRLTTWKAKGYDVSSVETVLPGDPTALTVAFLSLNEAIRRAEAVEETLGRIDVKGFESRAEAIRRKLKDALKHPDIDAEVESLRDAIEGRRQIETRRELEQVREKDSQERTRKVLQLVMKQQAMQPEAPTHSSDDVARVLEGPAPTRDEATNLIQQFTFDAFVVSEGSRFAHAAAVAVAKQPGTAYNPLVVASGPGLGKTHLLHAIGNDVRARSKDLKVLCTSGPAFFGEFLEAKERGTLPAFRARVRAADCLLLDDVQTVTGRPDIQEEILHTFEDLLAADKQVVLASDRAPKAIPDFDERLVSRLESGVVATIQPPSKEARVAILRRRASDARADVSDDVLTYIADLVEDNVRELGGAFNRVVAFSSLMGRPITRDLAKEVLREVNGEAPREGILSVEDAERSLTPGRSYLVEEDRPDGAFRLFQRAFERGKAGLVITRTNPKRIRERFTLEADRVLWLTDRESKEAPTIPPALERIVYEIEDFMSKKPGAAVLLDGLEYLVSNNSFEAVLKFARRLVDTMSESQSVFLMSLGPATLREQELKMLEREMDVVRFG